MQSRAILEFGVAMPMLDGTILRADIVRPDTNRPVPVILMRNPYGRLVARQHLDQIRAVERGFAVVSQSVRGTGASDGEFVPWRHEVGDGRDSIAWCAQQPWSSGAIGMSGGSYLGQAQLYASMAGLPALRAITPFVVPADPYRQQYEGGAFLLGSALDWAWGRAGERIARLRERSPSRQLDDDWDRWQAANDDIDRLYRTTPLRDVPILDRYWPAWADWLDHPTHDEWWARLDLGSRPALPMMIASGWWDLWLRESLGEWAREPHHPASRLVVGPWSHHIDGQAHGDVDYGASASAAAQDLSGAALGFLGRHVADQPAPDGPPVRLFVMGVNRWRDADRWPPSGISLDRFFFREGGLLARETPEVDAAPTRFVHDPSNPVPTIGGRNSIPGSTGAHLTGPVEQSRLDDRPDVVRFTSAPLPDDLEVIGGAAVTLSVTTTAADTDWTAKLVDVGPDGSAYNVADGIVRASLSSNGIEPRLMSPGLVSTHRIELAPTAHAFLSGHRIRVEIASSNFPRFDRNPGTGGSSADVREADFVRAARTIFVDAERASWVDLPASERRAG